MLGKITHKRSYTIETRDRKCTWGTIAELTTEDLTAKVRNPKSPDSTETLTFRRADVLRVASGQLPYNSGRIYYSGRSSWLDVSSIRLGGRERLKVVTKAGKTYETKPPYTVFDDGITLQSSGESRKVTKSEIAQVYVIVQKPLTDFGEYSLDELGPMVIFDPDWYVHGLHLEQYVPVLLYNVTDPEDNSPAQCAPR